MVNQIVFFVFLIFYFGISPVQAGRPTQPGSISGTYGAKNTALSGGAAVVAEEVTTLFVNPSGVGFLSRSEFACGYQRGLVDTWRGYLGYVHNFQRFGLGTGLAFYDAGTTEIYDTLSGTNRTINAGNDFTANICGSWNIIQSRAGTLGLGLGLKLIGSTLAEQYTSATVGADVGFIYGLPENRLVLGASRRNLSSGISYLGQEIEKIPVIYNIGGEWKVVNSPDHQLAVVVNYENSDIYPLSKYGLGIAYGWKRFFSFRMGYNTLAKQLTFGGGIRLGRYQLDYVMLPNSELGDEHYVSLNIRVGKVPVPAATPK